MAPNGLIQGVKDFVASAMSPQEQAEIPLKTAAMESIREQDAQGKDARTQLYELLNSKQDALTIEKRNILNQMGTDAPMSKSQVAAMLLIGILPTLVGGAVKGKKGLAAGAEASAIGTQVMQQGLQNDQNRADLLRNSQISTIDSQLSDIESLRGKATLDEINATDTAAQKALDRDATLNAAAIRAGGDRASGAAMGRELGNVLKQLNIDKLEGEKSARNRAVEHNGKVMTGTVTDDDRKKMNEETVDYDNLRDNLIAIEELSNNAQFGGLSRSINERKEEINTRREAALAAIANIQSQNKSNSGNYLIKRMEKALVAPGDTWENIKAGLPFVASMKDQIGIARRVTDEAFTNYLKGKGLKQVNIGTPMIDTRTNKKIYLLGSDPETGNLDYTTDINKVNEKLQSLNLPPIGE